MIRDDDFALLGKGGSFCSECKFVLNSIYSIGTALSIDECESVTDKKSKDRNLLLNDRVETPYDDIINKNDKKCNNSQLKLFSSTPCDKCKGSITEEEEIEVVLHKKPKAGENSNADNKICMTHDGGKYSTCVKPIIIEDKILQSQQKLNIDDLKKQKLQISNSKCDYFKCSTSSKAIKNVDKPSKGSTNYCKDLKNVYGIEKQNGQLTDINCTKIQTCHKSQNTENEAHDTIIPNYFSQYSMLKNAVSNRRKKVSNIAKNLLTLSTYLNGICKTIFKAEDSNQNSVQPDISFNLSNKVDKSTSPILFSKSYSTATDLVPSQENTNDMYRYNPYRNILQKKK